ncbi:hypothetical protein MRX96_054709, partial [Rhipicephalus microplus]
GVALITLGGVRVTRSRSRDRSASCARIQQEPTWAERVGPKRESRTIVQRQLPEQATARIQQLERENATLRSELQEIKALVEELRQRERTPEGAVKVQQAEAQPRGGELHLGPTFTWSVAANDSVNFDTLEASYVGLIGATARTETLKLARTLRQYRHCCGPRQRLAPFSIFYWATVRRRVWHRCGPRQRLAPFSIFYWATVRRRVWPRQSRQ